MATSILLSIYTQRLIEMLPFATGLDENNNHSPLDVLINVRMLTEGADVPTVQTVFITRQTTSQILMTQMIGRALRGEKAGGSSEANIILFFDDWKRLIDWADPAHEDGGTKETPVLKRERYPLEYIAIHLVEELSKSFENGGDYEMPAFSRIFPIGWYKTEITYAEDDESQDTMETVTEFVMVYEHTQRQFQDFIKFIDKAYLKEEWAKERLEYEWIESQIESWIKIYFDDESDNIGEKLSSSVAKIVRHIAQNESVPHYYPFEDRELYDVDRIAQKIVNDNLSYLDKNDYLTEEFSRSNSLWETFYRSFNHFESSVDASIRSYVRNLKSKKNPPLTFVSDALIMSVERKRELTTEEKKLVKNRDGNACLCCSASGKGIRLEIDHVFPFSMGGETTVENSQTLCDICNKFKNKNEIDFRSHKTPLISPKEFNPPEFLPLTLKDQDINTQSLTRIINFFYNCSAVSYIKWNEVNRTKYYKVWEICLYFGNNPKWLTSIKAKLLELIHKDLGCPRVEDIKITVNNST